ncbi:hypothetical protein IE53DRAFT_380854 [Violaceomyces palustris]|uniref:Uncharacterized protein n=2 Tax=Violaceomyces palustris TaxID=1673888 RepID=A0ACD0NTA3_9BASI|nr:hypothetical protein IE53DRAFT_380854 [Violaceomyces palustris]
MSGSQPSAASSGTATPFFSQPSSTPHSPPVRNPSSLRNQISTPVSPNSDLDDGRDDILPPAALASRLGRTLGSAAGASSLSLNDFGLGSGSSSPSLALTGFNAISTVLNNPGKRQPPIDPKSSRFPPVTTTPHVFSEIPKVKKAELDGYLSSVRPEWDRFVRNQRLGRQGRARIGEANEKEHGGDRAGGVVQGGPLSAASPLISKARGHHRASSLSVDLSSQPPPPPKKRLPPLSAVPQVFFSEDFDLGNPYTFDLVTERYKAAAAAAANHTPTSADSAYDDGKGGGSGNGIAPGYDVALNQMLQEKLSYYSDVIEQHLILEIGSRSSSFFAALGNLKDLSAEAEACLAKIHNLKSDLDKVDQAQAKKGLEIIREQEKRRQLQRKEKAIDNVRRLVEKRDLTRLLVQQGEFEEALEMIQAIRDELEPKHDTTETRSDGAGSVPKLTLPPSSGAADDDGGGGDVRDEEVGGRSSGPGATTVKLSAVTSLSFILPQLDEMEVSISQSLQQELLDVLQADLNSRVENQRAGAHEAAETSGGEQDNLYPGQADGRLSPAAATPASTEGLSQRPPPPPSSPFGNTRRSLSPEDVQLRSRIMPIVVGLVRTGGVDKAVLAYREVALRSVRSVWESRLGSGHQDDDLSDLTRYLEEEDGQRAVAEAARTTVSTAVTKLRDMDARTFVKLGRTVFDGFLACIRSVDAQSRLLLRVLDEYQSTHSASAVLQVGGGGDDGHRSFRPTATSLLDESRDAVGQATTNGKPPHMPAGVAVALPNTLSDIVHATTELTHTLSSRLISLRSSQHSSLDLASFLSIFRLCWDFITSSEVICRRMIVGLRGAALGQAKSFLASFHRARIERAAKAVEEETWALADVGSQIQEDVEAIVESAIKDSVRFVVHPVEEEGQGAKKQEDRSEAPLETAAAKTLEIEGRSYFVVAASLDVLRLLADYLRVVINLPLLTTEAMGRAIEFLKQFNSRTCQVVLGAGAMRSAGLKNITAKHLALASQSLSIMISLTPYVRETVRRHLNPKQAVMLTEFDKLRRDFQEHQYEIHAKLVAIMSDRLTVHCRTLNNVDWNAARPENGKVEANDYVSDLIRETATLHKVLSKYLQVQVVEQVIGQVVVSIDRRLATELAKVEVQTQEARDRLEADVDLLNKKLSSLKNVEWKGENLKAMLEAQVVPVVANGSSPAQAAEQPSSTAATATTATPAAQAQPQPAYKPRIPSLFSRRNQQQGRDKPSDSASPLTNSRTSVEESPRGSLQSRSEDEGAAVPGGGESTTTTITTLPGSDGGLENEKKGKEEGEEKEEKETLPTEVVGEEQGRPPTPPSKTSPPTLEKEDTSQARSNEVDGEAEVELERPEGGVTVETEVKEKEGEKARAKDDSDMTPTRSAGRMSLEARLRSVACEEPISPMPIVTSGPTETTIPSSPGGSGRSTPSSKPRMSLKERLAEAARKRSQMQQQQQQVKAQEDEGEEGPRGNEEGREGKGKEGDGEKEVEIKMGEGEGEGVVKEVKMGEVEGDAATKEESETVAEKVEPGRKNVTVGEEETKVGEKEGQVGKVEMKKGEGEGETVDKEVKVGEVEGDDVAKEESETKMGEAVVKGEPGQSDVKIGEDDESEHKTVKDEGKTQVDRQAGEEVGLGQSEVKAVDTTTTTTTPAESDEEEEEGQEEGGATKTPTSEAKSQEERPQSGGKRKKKKNKGKKKK